MKHGRVCGDAGAEVGSSLVLGARSLVGPGVPRAPRNATASAHLRFRLRGLHASVVEGDVSWKSCIPAAPVSTCTPAASPPARGSPRRTCIELHHHTPTWQPPAARARTTTAKTCSPTDRSLNMAILRAGATLEPRPRAGNDSDLTRGRGRRRGVLSHERDQPIGRLVRDRDRFRYEAD